jgi:hypothetical protein
MSAVPSRSVEDAVAPQLALTDALAPAELKRIRRSFAYRNHPTRWAPRTRPMPRSATIANVLTTGRSRGGGQNGLMSALSLACYRREPQGV